MASPNFVDYVKIYFKSGDGGNGITSWRREAHVPKGGPDGGDGGDGGSIVLVGEQQLWTLLDLKYRKHIKAPRGEHGQGSRKKGKRGKDVILKVPLGTVVKDAETGEMLGEVKEQGEELVVAEGGRGGLGNWHFRSATNQAPEKSFPGHPGVEITCILELKVLADVGLVGFPNAGKSTLLSVVTAAKPKIGAYPFTTLVPNLGIVKYHGYKSFVIADIPGIIEGAHEGKGLGIRFLRHIERNAVLLFLIPADSDDHKKEYETLLGELTAYNPELLEKERVVGISKADILFDELEEDIRKQLKDENPVFFSAVSGRGLSELKDILFEKIQRAK